MRTRTITGVLVGSCAVALSASVAAAAETPATVSVFGGLPDIVSDVYVGEQQVVSELAPGEVSPPIALKPGEHIVTVVPTGSSRQNAADRATQTISVQAGTSTTVSVFLDPAGTESITQFANSTRAAEGKAVLDVRHVAQSAAIDLKLNDKPVLNNLRSGQSSELTVAPGGSSLVVTEAGSASPMIGPLGVKAPAGGVTAVYVWGEPGSWHVTTQDLAAVQSTSAVPTSIPAGEGADAGRWAAWGLAAAGLTAIGGSLTLVRRSSPVVTG
ncbi:MAG: hypothetical protein CSA58_05830 [Micrococcales bacterium]|nr:MAG: hypothetical protein CSB46_04900 [Micrococcales bacterium]PIE27162.1 MAG: hypothetical protein CSA58_05830 [Micrococcales bacterium]